MLLAREFVDYISRQTIRKLSPLWIETTDVQVAGEFMSGIIEDDLAVEDQLNDEVREMLSQYSEYMRKEGVSYQDMFRRIKNTLITQRKVIRAAGRDAGDQMKLSRDKINDLSHKIVAALRKSRDFRLKRDPNDVRLEMVKIITELLQTEEKVGTRRLVRRFARRSARSPRARKRGSLAPQARYYAEEPGRSSGSIWIRARR